MSWSGTYQFVSKSDREEFLKILNGATCRCSFDLKPSTPAELGTSLSVLVPTVSKLWPDTTWYTLRKWFKTSVTWLGKIPVEGGYIAVWRNGNNYGDYNYVIYCSVLNKFFFRKGFWQASCSGISSLSNEQVINLLEMLLCKKEKNLPEFMARELCEENNEFSNAY